MTLYTGRVILTLPDDNIIGNVKSIKWRRIRPVTPRFNSSSESLVGYLMGHYHFEGEFQVVSDADFVIDEGYGETYDATVQVEKTDGTFVTYTFQSFCIIGPEPSFDESSDRNPVLLVKFLAASVTKGD